MNTLNRMLSGFILTFAVVSVAALAPAGSAAWAATPINTLQKKGLIGYKSGEVAIRGFDTVAYFTKGEAVKGAADHSYEWNGAQWYFSSAEHKEMFVQNPERFAPQFGGYCALGVAEGYLAKIEGSLWSIVDGKLYLNYNRKYQQRWLKDPQGYIARAEARFAELLREKGK